MQTPECRAAARFSGKEIAFLRIFPIPGEGPKKTPDFLFFFLRVSDLEKAKYDEKEQKMQELFEYLESK